MKLIKKTMLICATYMATLLLFSMATEFIHQVIYFTGLVYYGSLIYKGFHYLWK